MTRFILIFLLLIFTNAKTGLTYMTKRTYQYLALGDSYTIGEMVPFQDNFPSQTARLLTNDTTIFNLERIVAKTGWTTDELESGIIASDTEKPFLSSYDFVTLLIGVNNQYRGRSVDNYSSEFEELLRKAIRYAGNRADHVVVLSIPDWGITPFAEGRDREQIAKEIDVYNATNKQIAEEYRVHYINITPWTREAATDNSLLAVDGLHPSGKEYKRWAEKIARFFHSKL